MSYPRRTLYGMLYRWLMTFSHRYNWHHTRHDLPWRRYADRLRLVRSALRQISHRQRLQTDQHWQRHWQRRRRSASKGEQMSDVYMEHARRELQALGYKLDDSEDGPNKWIQENIFSLLKVFGEQGHSGMSAPYVADLFNKLAKLEPAAPLRGTDDEWVEVSDGVWQNNRCSHVFKEANGRAYDIEGRIFRDPDGSCCTNRDSRVYIDFPYTPKREYVDRP